MLLPMYSTAIICGVLIITGAVSAEDVKKAVGQEVSFTPAKFTTTVTSITWKQKGSDATVKVIEWDVEDGVIDPPNPRFQGITKLDGTTGRITISDLKVEHSGVYTIDINSKEQEQRFNLNVMERVPKPVITTEESGNSDVVYLRCEYNEIIIWKNSSGVIPNNQKGEMQTEIVVENRHNPENFYTCTLKNDVSEETSAPVFERDLFKGRVGVFSSTELTNMKVSNAGLTAGIVISIILLLLIIAFVVVYLRIESFRDSVNTFCPCIEKAYAPAAQGEPMKTTDQQSTEENRNENNKNHQENDSSLEGKGHGEVAE